MTIKAFPGLCKADLVIGLSVSMVTAVLFCYILLTNNNALNPYYMLYGPVSSILNYQIQWNNIFPQTLFETGDYVALFKIVGFISVLWIVYWGLTLSFIVSFVRRKKYWDIVGVVCLVCIINYVSAMFQKWFVGTRIIM